jgi:YidC/Oxa1 family membrane protein insertase
MIGAYMAVVMLWFGWLAPAGVLLYWDMSSLWGIAQQQLTMAAMKRTHHEEPEVIQVEEPKVSKSAKKKNKRA